MNSEIIKLLSNEQENALKNQEERKIKENQEMQEFIEKAKRNSRELNNEIFKTIIKAFIESKKRPKEDGFEYFYDNIGYPNAIIEGNTIIGSSSRCRIVEKLTNFVNEKELQLAQFYNKSNHDNKVVFLVSDDENVIPAMFYNQEYKELKFYFFFDYDVTIRGYDNQRHIDQLLKNISEGKYDNLNIINEQIKDLAKDILNKMKNRKAIAADYQRKCNINANHLLLYICKYFLEEYRKNPNTDYSLNLPCLSNQEEIFNELDEKDLLNYNDYLICSSSISMPVMFVAPDRKLGNKTVYKQVLKWKFLYMIKELGLKTIISDGKLQITTNPLELEQTIINASKNNTKKK